MRGNRVSNIEYISKSTHDTLQGSGYFLWHHVTKINFTAKARKTLLFVAYVTYWVVVLGKIVEKVNLLLILRKIESKIEKGPKNGQKRPFFTQNSQLSL